MTTSENFTNQIAEPTESEALVVTKCQNKQCLDDTYHSSPFGGGGGGGERGRLHRIEKRSSHGHLLEQLESSGTKIMMRGILVGYIKHYLCMGRYR